MVKNSHHSGDWLLKAENELKAAKAIYNYYEEPPTDMVCYHCHQTAEKALKGYLVYRQINFPKIHDLVALLNLCAPNDKSLQLFKDDMKVLNQYYIEAKYPPDMPIVYSKEEAKEAINKATRVLKTVRTKTT